MEAPNLPPLSTLQTLLLNKTNPPTNIPPTTSPHHYALALQVQHNLQHQHDWTSLRIHTHSSPGNPSHNPPTSNPPSTPLPRPLISGLPPQRIYIHPDEQVEMLKRGGSEAEAQKKGRVREWVLPANLREKWTLRRFGEVFDGLPPEEEGIGGQDGKDEGRGVKRLLLAVVGDDSTVVYYIVHDGIVKPRQN